MGAVLALFLWPPRDRAPGDEPDRADPKRLLGFSRVGVVAAVALVVGIPGALAMAMYRPATLMADGTIVGRGGVVVLEPETWVGKRFPLIEHIDIGGQLAYGDWLVVLYRHDCPGCQELLSGLAKDAAAWDMDPLGTRLALIELPPYGSSSVDPVLSGFTLGRLAGPWKWAVATPTEITLTNGRVVNASTSVQTIGRLERLPRDRLGQRFALDHGPRSCDRCYNHRSERNPKRERGACLWHSLAYASGYYRMIAVSESGVAAICAAS